MYKILIIFFLTLISFNSFSQTFWKVGNEYGDEILLTLNQDHEKKTFNAYTRKDALKDIAGTFMYTVARAAGKLKYPEIVFIEGSTQKVNDSLLLKGPFYYFDKQFSFSATIFGNNFKGRYIDAKNKSHQLIGVKVNSDKPIRDYASIVNSAFSTTEQNLFNPVWLKSGDWVTFKKKVNDLKAKISDDYELAAIFFWLGKELPFSPYEISKITPRKKTGRRNDAAIREIKSNAAIFDANRLPVSLKEMDSLSVIIAKKAYTNLIFDLRGKNSPNPCSANILVGYLSDKAFNAGIYLTRKWFDGNMIVPKSSEYKKMFKGFNDAGYQADEFYKEQGRFLDVVPVTKSFKGKVYVLTDSKTSRVAEAMVYILKKEKIATIVGQKTAGASMLYEHILIINGYEIYLPVSDYFTSEGKSLNKIGIEPDIPVSGDDAMKYVLKVL